MKKHYASKTGLFLIELILSIFFFIIAAAVVLQLFVKSHFLSESTISINNALLYTQNMSEVFLANDGNFEAVKSLYADNLTDLPELSDHSILLLFDKNWNAASKESDAKYCVLADYSKDENFSYLNIYINKFDSRYRIYIAANDYKSALLDSGLIYHQEVKKYIPQHIVDRKDMGIG